MRIIAGSWRGRVLSAPSGDVTRPTADRLRQSLFDMLQHAPWCGRELLDGAPVLDVFAGTGALGLEALSRGASHATFIENNRAALACLRANVTACRSDPAVTILAVDAVRPSPRPSEAAAATLVFLDPPYGRSLVPAAVAALSAAGWIAPDALMVVETGRDEDLALPSEMLAERSHGAGRITIWRRVA